MRWTLSPTNPSYPEKPIITEASAKKLLARVVCNPSATIQHTIHNTENHNAVPTIPAFSAVTRRAKLSDASDVASGQPLLVDPITSPSCSRFTCFGRELQLAFEIPKRGKICSLPPQTCDPRLLSPPKRRPHAIVQLTTIDSLYCKYNDGVVMMPLPGPDLSSAFITTYTATNRVARNNGGWDRATLSRSTCGNVSSLCYRGMFVPLTDIVALLALRCGAADRCKCKVSVDRV
ncbi:hypothetical protein J6590_013131 [Homalodisca vitripennis]|nr:hypothetical protein J6590_013131 [Homalodisca vitripennis]